MLASLALDLSEVRAENPPFFAGSRPGSITNRDSMPATVLAKSLATRLQGSECSYAQKFRGELKHHAVSATSSNGLVWAVIRRS